MAKVVIFSGPGLRPTCLETLEDLFNYIEGARHEYAALEFPATGIAHLRLSMDDSQKPAGEFVLADKYSERGK